jgi:hydrogenase expression/formation protein HypE
MSDTPALVDLSHGAGGRATMRLVAEIFYTAFDNAWLRRGDDSAVCPTHGQRLAISTDAFVVSPLFFPGGDIGALAVHGAINDVAMSGAQPAYLTASFIIEEGFPIRDLACIAQSMGAAAREARVAIVAGDTKVVERGKADGVFISTTAIGFAPEHLDLSGANAQPGDVILLSGTIGDHGVAVMSERQNPGFDCPVKSDTAPLHGLVTEMIAAVGPALRLMRDPTRGGLAATLNEIARQSRVGFRIEEKAIPVTPAVTALSELLGLDPLNIANEGKLVAVVAPHAADALLEAMRGHALGRDAAIIGYAFEDPDCLVEMKTRFGGVRIVDWLAGEQLPRIC